MNQKLSFKSLGKLAYGVDLKEVIAYSIDSTWESLTLHLKGGGKMYISPDVSSDIIPLLQEFKDCTGSYASVDGRLYPTQVNEKGERCFVKNKLTCYLVASGQVNLSKLEKDYEAGIGGFSQRELLEFMMGLGFTVGAIANHKAFKDLVII